MHDLALYDFDLPAGQIAQEPAAPRDAARLLVLDRGTRSVRHHTFRDLPGLLSPGDLLVLNDTRVVPARLLGRRARTGGRWEGLFVREHPGRLWELLSQTRGRLQPGEQVLVDPLTPGDPPLALELTGRTPAEGRWLARPQAPGETLELLQRHGQVPIPPYIRKGQAAGPDRERYQTLYARHPGAVAAPTAGLHFTEGLFAGLAARGVGRAFVTLHVGPGTFQPVKAEDVRQHRVEAEWGALPADTAAAVNAARARGNRVVAVGTTTVRVLETAGRAGPPLAAWSGAADLTVCPPYSFRVVDALVTNFHLPRSSLLLLVAAFAGPDTVLDAYRTAVALGYRFYSYGDAMLIL